MKLYGLLILAFFVPCAAHADSIEIVTSRGNVFVLDGTDALNESNDGAGNGTSMLDGIGINSRLVHEDYTGKVIHATGLLGKEQSIKPYNTMHPQTKFVTAVLDTELSRLAEIPEFYHGYDMENVGRDGGVLSRVSSNDHPNILGYTDSREINGNAQVDLYDKILIGGKGRTVLHLDDHNAEEMVLTGKLSQGTTIRLVESPYNLITITHDATRGFLINHCTCNPATTGLALEAGSADDSEKSATFQYTQNASASVYHGKCCKGRYTVSGTNTVTVNAPLIIQPDATSRYHVIVGDTANPQNMNIGDILRPGAKIFRINYNNVGDFNHWIYDTLPVREIHAFSGNFETTITLPSGNGNYLIIDSAGGTSEIKGTALGQRNFIDVSGVAPDTGYSIIRDGHTIAAGFTTKQGTISIPAPDSDVSSEIGGVLHIHDKSIMYSAGSPSIQTVIFDHHNDATLHDTIHDRIFAESKLKDTLYNVHAYVKIPVIGDVTITGINLDERLSLQYLDGNYTDGQSIFVPVIPTYQSIHMRISGVPISLNVADVLSGTGLYIADSVSDTITQSNPDGFIHSVQSTAGAIAYMVATHDGNAKAHVQATISGTSEITNTRKYLGNPPPPPPPRPTDPLTTWIEVYINGEITPINGNTRTQIFFSDTPETDHTAQSHSTSATHIARFSYPEITITDTISVPVREADFVEFYFYNQIFAQGSIPPVPSGFTEYQRSGTASATAVLRYASINTSM